jgi:4-hydroxybenzoate polyprenyltransferase
MGEGVAIAQAGQLPQEREGMEMLLVLAIVLLIIAIAGGVIIHPLLFILALVALAMFFSSRRGARI